MNSTKNVIEIIKHARHQFEYDEHYYFTEVQIIEGKTSIRTTGDIWKATRFNEMTEIEQNAWYKFIKSFFGKHYTVNFKTISLTYDI